jgi:hypothetical protein
LTPRSSSGRVAGVRSGEPFPHQRGFAFDDDGEEFVGALHLAEGVEAALQEGVQFAQAGEVRGAVHQPERDADQRHPGQTIQGLSDPVDQGDLQFAVGAPAAGAVGGGIALPVDAPDPSGLGTSF